MGKEDNAFFSRSSGPFDKFKENCILKTTNFVVYLEVNSLVY